MKRHFWAAVCCLSIFAFANTANAQSLISWGASTSAFEAGNETGWINLDGSLVLASNASDSANASVNYGGFDWTNDDADETFAGITQNDVTLTTANGDGAQRYANAFGPGQFADPENFYNGGNFDLTTITLTGLTAGDEYLIQVLGIDDRGTDVRNTIFGDGTQTVGDSLAAGTGVGLLLRTDPTGAGGFITGTFTADSSGSQTIDITGNRNADLTQALSGSTAQYNALQVRNITAVPEPGSLALLGMGVFGLVARRRRK